jgi:galactitol-specific phosphotransferase system IIC component
MGWLSERLAQLIGRRIEVLSGQVDGLCIEVRRLMNAVEKLTAATQNQGVHDIRQHAEVAARSATEARDLMIGLDHAVRTGAVKIIKSSKRRAK